MKQYVDLVKRVLSQGELRDDRTGTGTKAVFGGQVEFDLRESFPLVTVKKTLYKAAFIEMLWFLRGEPNIDYLKANNVHIWDEWADERGALGPVYGVQWRSWPGKVYKVPFSDIAKITDPEREHRLHDVVKHENWIGFDGHRAENGDQVYLYQERIDQLDMLIARLKGSPTGRRHIVNAWNVPFISDMGLPPCHRDFQCYASNDGGLDLMMSQRSWDLGLGAPFNIAQYALLTHLIALAVGRKPRKLIINYGDAHLYVNHIERMTEVVHRKPMDPTAQLVIKPKQSYAKALLNKDGYTIDDFEVTGYKCHDFVQLPIAV